MHANDIDALADRIAETATQLDAGTHRLLTDIRVFDQQQGWGRQGALSCAHWLGWRCGIALGAAREKVRVAHALGALPLIDDALRLAQISFSKVGSSSRVTAPPRGCRFPGCTYTRYLDAHHVTQWIDGGETSLANTLLLCGRHHTLVHEGGFRVVVDGTDARFFDPAGIELPEVGIPPLVGTRRYEIGAPSPGWDGQRVDYDAAVASLL